MKEREGRHKLYLKTPAGWHGDMWREALPAGNGTVGAAVYGAVREETILVNHKDLWHWGKRGTVPAADDCFREMRSLIEAGNYREANGKMADTLLKRGYQSELYKPCPVGDIRMEMELEEPFTEYSRCLDMETGEVSVSWRMGDIRYERKLFVSRADQVIVCKIAAYGGHWSGDVFMELHRTGDEDTQRMLRETEGKRTRTCFIPYMDYRVRNEDGTWFGMTGKVLKADGCVSEGKNSGIHFSKCKEAVLIWEVFAGKKEKDREVGKTVPDKAEGSYESLLDRHRKLHGRLYHSVKLELTEQDLEMCSEELLLQAYGGEVPEVLVEKMWHYGRYLFISGTSENGNPFPMYGLWGGRYDLPWSHNMANINIQMIYWHCCKGGMAEFVKAMVEYYTGLLSDFRENARKMFGMNGIWIPAGTTPGYGLVNQVVPVIVNWISAGGWLCTHFCEYFRYTRDYGLLENKIFPFFMETLAFYKDYLVTGEDGFYEIYPSVSPENTPAQLQSEELVHLAHANPVTKNATMDFAILKEFLGDLVFLGECMNCDPAEMEEWKEMKKKIPAYLCNEEGAIREWMTEELGDFYYHRHISHLYPVFPGKEFGVLDEAAKQAFEKALDLRVLGGQTSWSLIHMGGVYARLGRGEDACRCLKHICRTCLTASFYTLHNDYRNMGMTVNLGEFAPIQLDAAVGFAAVIQEMLFQVLGNTLKILPSIPAEWKKGRVSGICFPDGKANIEWNVEEKKLSCTIRAVRSTDVHVVLPVYTGGTEAELHLNAGEEWKIAY